MEQYSPTFDPAEVPPSPRAMLQYEQNRRKETDVRDAVQKKTFTKWVNKHLLKAGRRIVDLFEDLRDGHNLISLLEVLAHESLPREKGRMKFHKIQNVQIALEFLRRKGIKLVNIRSDEIVDGNPKLSLGLIWTIILHYQISEVVVPGQPEDISSKEALKIWGQRTVEGYPGVKIRNFTNSWRDGKAFLAIIHRNRPDLIDISRTRHNNNRQNLELAFGTAERELAVTRLLDPEDVDVPEPDEKSIITYVSSLYDVFPEVPSVEQTLRDNERQIKQEEYRDLASSLCMWLKEATNIMMDKTFPTTLIEMRSVLAECKRFRTEDIPPRLDTKQKLLRIYDEIQGLGPGTGDMGIPDEFHPDNINRLWNRFTFAQQERDSLVQSEVVRLERLQRLAEKLHRDCKYQEDKLDEVAIGVYEEQGRVDVVHPHEAKRKCDALDEALRNIEENARSMFRDVQALQDGRFSTAEQLSRRVSSIKSRVSQLRTQLFGEVVQKLISKSYVEEGVTVTRRREYVTEIKPTDMNPTFKHVHECLSWVENKQAELESREYGTDLSTVETLCSSHQLEHQQIQNFRREIEKCISDGRILSPEDQNLYAEWLSKVEVAYSLLIKTSTRRSRSLDSLREFLQTAMQELIWLNDKEDQQVTREINITTDPQTTDGAYKSLIHELELREVQFNSVQEQGTALVLDRHPAADTIKAYMEEMQSQWSLLLQLTLCLESHVKSITTYHQFFQECRQCGSEMTQCSELLNTIYGQENLSIDDAKRQISDLHKMQEQLTEFDKQIANLIQTSDEVIPLEKRTEHVTSESTVQCLCTYRHQKEILQRGQEYELLDTSSRTKWKVALSNGDEELLPSICFVIPPPNKDAISQAERLHVQFEHLHSLWKMRQRSTKHNMILNTVRVIKNWDLKQFMSLEPGRREMFWRTVNEDAEKLITEVGETTHEMRKLRGELAECNQIFLSLSATAQEEESHKTKSPDQKLIHEVDSFNKRFMDCEQELMSRLQDHLPRDKLGLRHIVEQQKVWEANASELENGVDVLKSTYASLPHKSHIAESKYHAVVQRWDQIRSLSRVYLDRLKATDSLLTGIEQMRQLVADCEIALVSHDNMSADPDTFRQVHEELQDLDSSIQQQQPKLDRLSKDVENLRVLLKHCRPGTSRHNDLETVDKEVDGLRHRWEHIILQIVERRRVFESSSNLLSLYTSGVKDEQQWMKRLQMKINQLPPLTNNIEEVQQQIEPSMAIYNGLGEHQHQLESVNKYGGQFIREAKIYDRRLRQYKTSLEDIDAALVESMTKKQKREDGAERVKTELDIVNKQYMDMVKWISHRLKEITRILSESNVNLKFQMVIDEEIPLLRTFRAELAKRSSMLVDEDMEGYFHQLSEFEGYPTPMTTTNGYGGKSFVSKVTAMVDRPIGTSTPRMDKTESTMDSMDVDDSPQVQKRMISPPLLAPNRLSMKVASITSVQALHQSAPPEDHMSNTSQILVTVKQECIAPSKMTLYVSAILNPQTGRQVSLVDAIKTGLFDSRTGFYVDPLTSRRLSLQEAYSKGYISDGLLQQLNSSCGLTDPVTNRQIPLLDAMKKGIFDPVKMTYREPNSGQNIPLHQAVSKGLISQQTATNLGGDGVTVTTITQSQAVFGSADLSVLESALGLADAIEKGLFDSSTGKIIDPLSGKSMTILEAVEKGHLNPSKKEIKDPASGEYISLVEAVSKGLIDPESGLYINRSNGQKLPLDQAYQRQFLSKPLYLPKAIVEGSITEKGHLIDPNSSRVISFSDALDNGVLDDSTKCVMIPSSGEVFSIREAIENGILDSRGLFVSPGAEPAQPIASAVQKGYLKLVSEEVLLARPCVKDSVTNKMLTVPEAMRKGIITSNGDFVDTRTGRRVLLRAAASQGLVDKDVVEKLTRDTSMKDASGKNVSLLKAIQIGMLDPERGEITDARTGRVMTLNMAAKEGIISTDDAQTVLEVLSPAITYTSVQTKLQPGNEEVNFRPISVSEALSQGLLVERTGTFRDPHTGSTMPVEEAIQKGLLRLSTEWPPTSLQVEKDEESSEEIEFDSFDSLPEPGASKVQSKIVRKGNEGFSFTSTTISRPAIAESVVSQTRHIEVQSITDPRTKERISPQEAVKRGILDLSKGCFIHPLTGHKFTINEAIAKGLATGQETDKPHTSDTSVKEIRSFAITSVIHPRTREKISVTEAVNQGILDRERGLYMTFDQQGRRVSIPISEAVDNGWVLAEDIGTMPVATGDILRETKTFQLKSVKHPITGKFVPVIEAVKDGILDEGNGLYINTRTGEKLSVPDAIEKKLIEAELTSVTSNDEGDGSKMTTTKMTTLMVSWVVHPRTGETISIQKAVEEGIIDNVNAQYINIVTGERMSINDAIERKLAIATSNIETAQDRHEISSIHITDEQETFEATLVEEITAETVSYSISSVIDPRTMNMISYDDAVLNGILDISEGLYINPGTGETLPINTALNKGLIHADVTGRSKEEELLHSAFSAGNLPFSLKNVTSVINPKTREQISAVTAIKNGLIDAENGTFLDTRTNTRIPLEDALKLGFISLSKSTDAADIERLQNISMEEPVPPSMTENGIAPSVVDIKLERSGARDEDRMKNDSFDEVLNYTTDVEQSYDGIDGDKGRTPQLIMETTETTRTRGDVKTLQSETVSAPSGFSYSEALHVGLIDPTSGKVRDPKNWSTTYVKRSRQ
ncbi:DST [Mytilus coruscus]|uniref:DST n=1 Tax=Mytilus coruscus TaxID=42192 RepID=A0A6J8E292_MYTCO|nr:DST [Mytilus coruscus]